MGLVWFDGFDHLTAAQMTRKYETFGGSVVSASNTRFNSGQCARFTSNVQGLTKVLTSNQAWRVGVAYNLQTYTNGHQMLYLSDGGTQQVTLNVENRNIVVRHAGTSTVICQSTRAFNPKVWYHIEWYIVVADSISTNGCVVRVNGEVWASANSGDTKNSSNASADRVSSLGATSTGYYLDDLYVYHDSVTTSPTFSGDLRVVQLTPNANGNYSQFTGSDGNSTDNYLLVDDTTTVDDDTTYVESDVVSNKDSYGLSNLASTPASIKGVAINVVAKKGDAGARTGRTFFRISGTDYESSDFSPATSYANHIHIAENSPATAAAWTESEVNGMEAGVKVQA